MNKCLFVGIDIGKTTIKAALLNADNDINNIIVEDSADNQEAILLRVESIIQYYINSYPDAIAGIGIASFGIVDTVRGIVVSSGTIRDWNNVQIQKRIENKYNIPVFVENDVKAALYGEYLSNPEYHNHSLSFVSIGTSVGIASICNSACLYGDNLKAGEVARLKTSESSLNFEDLISGKGISNQYSCLTGEEVDGEEIFRRSLGKPSDIIAKDIINNMVCSTTKLIEMIACFIDPQYIVLGGGVINNNNHLYNTILNKYKLTESSKKNIVIRSRMGNMAAPYGMAMISKQSGKWKIDTL